MHAVPELRSATPCATSTRTIALICAAILVILVAWVLVWPWSGEGDAVSHYLLAKQSLRHPASAMTVFARPLHKLLLVLPAQGGNTCARIFSALISVICAWQTIRLADDLKIRNAPLAALMLIFQPYAFALASDTMTELPMAMGIVIAIRLWLHNRPAASTLIASFLPLARPEGAFLLPLWAALLLTDKRIGPIIKRILSCGLLAVGMLCWALFSGIFNHDLLYIYHSWFWPADSRGTIGHGPLFHYVWHWPEYCGPVLLILFLAGVRRSFTHAMTLPLVVWALVFVLHSFLYWRGMFGSLGLLRWIVPTAPLTALVCLHGFNATSDWLARIGTSRIIRKTLAIAALVIGVLYPLAFYASGSYRYHGFALRRCGDYIRSHNLLADAPIFFRGDSIIVAELNLPYEAKIADNWFDHESQLKSLLSLPKGAIGCWDNQQAAMWHQVSIDELEKLGFTILCDDRREVPDFISHFYYGSAWMVRQRYVVLRKDVPAPTTQPADAR